MTFCKTSYISKEGMCDGVPFKKIYKNLWLQLHNNGRHHWCFPVNIFMWFVVVFFVFSFYISICSQKLFKLDFLENSAKITGKHLCRSLETPTRCLTERFAKIFKNYFFTEYLPTTLSDFLSTLFLDVVLEQIKTCLAISWRRSLSYRNQSVDSNRKSMDWFPYNRHSSIQ